MNLIRMTVTVDGLDPQESAALRIELADLPETNVKVLRTRDPGLVDSFLISLAANAVSALGAVLFRQLRRQPTTQRVVSVEIRTPGQFLKLVSTDPHLDEQLVKQLINNLLISNTSNEKHE